MNLIRFGVNLLGQQVSGKRIPFQVNIHLTDKCNLRCSYCYIDFDNAQRDLSLDQLEKILSDIRNLGGERISLEGGEPLARKDIGEIVDLIDDLGMECNINTNGFFLPSKIDLLKKVSTFAISLDGEREVHDELRGKGSFDRALDAIKVARKNGIRVNIFCVLTKKNRGSLDYLINLTKEFDCYLAPTSLFFNRVQELKGEDHSDEYSFSDDEYIALLDKLIEKKAAGERIIWAKKTLNYIKSWPLPYRQQSNLLYGEDTNGNKFSPITCNAGKSFCVIDTNGDLYTCDPYLGLTPHGEKRPNCIELGFEEALNQLPIGECQACNHIVSSELNQLFSLSPPIIGNLLSHYGK